MEPTYDTVLLKKGKFENEKRGIPPFLEPTYDTVLLKKGKFENEKRGISA